MVKSIVFCAFILFSVVVSSCIADDSGKYAPNKYGQREGAYRRPLEGQYIPMNDRAYYHVHDMRELGRYIHIPYPYDGGYGPYFGVNIPYVHMDVPYVHDAGKDYNSKLRDTVSKCMADAFNSKEFEIPTPKIQLTYGFPDITPKSSNQYDSPESTTPQQFQSN